MEPFPFHIINYLGQESHSVGYYHARINNCWCTINTEYEFYRDTKILHIQRSSPRTPRFSANFLCISNFGAVLPFVTVSRLLLNYNASVVWTN